MSNVRIELNQQNVRSEILNADFVIEECARVASERAASYYTKNGFHITKFKGYQRGHAIAFPNTEEHPE